MFPRIFDERGPPSPRVRRPRRPKLTLIWKEFANSPEFRREVDYHFEAEVLHLENVDNDTPAPTPESRARRVRRFLSRSWRSSGGQSDESPNMADALHSSSTYGTAPSAGPSGSGPSVSGSSQAWLPLSNVSDAIERHEQTLWGSNHQNYGSVGGPFPPRATETIPDSQSPREVKYVPPQTECHRDFSAFAEQSSPIHLLLRDIYVLFRMTTYLPWIFIPLTTKDSRHELYPSSRNIIVKGLAMLASIIEAVMLFLAPVMLILPIPPILLIVAGFLVWGFIWLFMYPSQGPLVVMSRVDVLARDASNNETFLARTMVESQLFNDERWLFLNGVNCSGADLQNNVDAIAQVFGRPVLGVYNRTYGLMADILECVIQRCLNYPTEDGRVAYEAVKSNLVDPEVRRVVLIAHSQGCIEASLVLDRLYAEIPAEIISKLVRRALISYPCRGV